MERIFASGMREYQKPVSYTHLDVYKRQVQDGPQGCEISINLIPHTVCLLYTSRCV